MLESQFDDLVVKAGTASRTHGVVLHRHGPSVYPHYDLTSRTASLSTTRLMQVSGDDGTHCVVVSYRPKGGVADYSIWCGDKFLEGRSMTEVEARQRCEEAADGRRRLQAKMMELLGTFNPPSHQCAFWVNWRKTKTLCAHAQAALGWLAQEEPGFKQALAQEYAQALAPEPGSAGQRGPLTLRELAFRVPVLFEGERGAGKTVQAREFARTGGYPRVEVGGHEGLEAADLLGFLVPYGPGQMVWKDGPLSEAFRRAQHEQVVLLIDELLRIPARELSVLLTALSPDGPVYRLRTGRILNVSDGVGAEEQLEAPVGNLCVVATTNVGAEYAVDDIDPALAERFVVLRKDTTADELERILTEVAQRRGLSADTARACLKFFEKMTTARGMGLVRHAPTTRTLCRALELAETDLDVKRAVQAQVLLWVARTSEGHPVAEQLDAVQEIITACFDF
jgi:MoxR-like ATPase